MSMPEAQKSLIVTGTNSISTHPDGSPKQRNGVHSGKGKQVPAKPKWRDPRLDFFRGVAMLIIFMAHVPSNHWARFIPARFGTSDAAEMFVFCSGFAAAIAFGGSFLRAGWWLGTARVAFRIFTLYIAHIMLFLSVAILTYVVTGFGTEKNYVIGLALNRFFEYPGQQLVGLFTLTYVPNYFDIMPMYIAVLAMMPIVILLQKIHTLVAAASCFALYVLQWVFQWDFPAAPFNPDIKWFFNPLGWQLLFFTGFFLSRGWVKPPPVNKALIGLAVLIVIFSFFMGNWSVRNDIPVAVEIYQAIKPYVIGKTDHGLLRYLHFLAVAYLAVVLLKGREDILYARLFDPVRKVGQQALSTFLFSMFLSRVAGMVLDQIGRDKLTFTLVNLTGMALVIAVAYLVAWFKSSPWQRAAY